MEELLSGRRELLIMPLLAALPLALASEFGLGRQAQPRLDDRESP